MQMIIAVVADRYIQDLVTQLMDQGISMTEVSSTGGFLSEGNTTIVIGIEKEKFDLVDAIFAQVLEDHKQEDGQPGAHLFAIDLERGLRI